MFKITNRDTQKEHRLAKEVAVANIAELHEPTFKEQKNLILMPESSSNSNKP